MADEGEQKIVDNDFLQKLSFISNPEQIRNVTIIGDDKGKKRKLFLISKIHFN